MKNNIKDLLINWYDSLDDSRDNMFYEQKVFGLRQLQDIINIINDSVKDRGKE